MQAGDEDVINFLISPFFFNLAVSRRWILRYSKDIGNHIRIWSKIPLIILASCLFSCYFNIMHRYFSERCSWSGPLIRVSVNSLYSLTSTLPSLVIVFDRLINHLLESSIFFFFFLTLLGWSLFLKFIKLLSWSIVRQSDIQDIKGAISYIMMQKYPI